MELLARMVSSDVPTWFPAASNDRFLPNDQIVLGSIITNPRQPENSLNLPDQLISIPEELLLKTVPEIKHSSQLEHIRDHTAGAQLKIAEFVDSELSHGWSNANTRGIDAARIASFNFRPSDEYVVSSIAQPKVAAHLKREVRYFKKTAPRLFMITGLKIAYEATLSRSSEASSTSTAKAAADLGGMQVAAGPFGSRRAKDKHETSFQPEGDFVYAVRLKKFVFQKKELVLGHEYYTDGAEIHGDDKKRKEEEKYEMEVTSEEDASAEMVGMGSVLVVDKDGGLGKFATPSVPGFYEDEDVDGGNCDGE